MYIDTYVASVAFDLCRLFVWHLSNIFTKIVGEHKTKYLVREQRFRSGGSSAESTNLRSCNWLADSAPESPTLHRVSDTTRTTLWSWNTLYNYAPPSLLKRCLMKCEHRWQFMRQSDAGLSTQEQPFIKMLLQFGRRFLVLFLGNLIRAMIL